MFNIQKFQVILFVGRVFISRRPLLQSEHISIWKENDNDRRSSPCP